MMKVGVALGGGGVRGLAHVLVLEALDELGIRPGVIAGTSMGAAIGALYASGMPGRDIRDRIEHHVILKGDKWRDVMEKKGDLLRWVHAFRANFSRGGLLNAKGFIRYLFDEIRVTSFEELDIPLLVVAADYWSAEQVVFDQGELKPAIQASMAVPGVFAPVAIEDRVLIDGGIINLVPYDLIVDECDFTIAVNVSRVRTPGRHDIPGALESVLGTFDIMQTAALMDKMKRRPPDIYVRFEIQGVRMLEIGKIRTVFEQATPIVEQFKEALTTALGNRNSAGDHA
ncbi:MAG: patatin-like phospholipase family protein [Syntrophobacteraceae bacterium]